MMVKMMLMKVLMELRMNLKMRASQIVLNMAMIERL